MKTTFSFEPAHTVHGFQMDGYWVWCGSAIRADDGIYHLFAARWPKSYPFFEGYISHSHIVRATSPTPEGPYEFQEVVLPARGEEFWDGQMTHNPQIVRYHDRYYLFYIGATYPGRQPSPEEHLDWVEHTRKRAYASIRIGVATSDSLEGPWQRRNDPILLPRPGKWDGTVVTNPAVCIRPDGGVYLYYRSNTPDGLRIGVASADNPTGPYTRVSDDPVLRFERGYVEDPFVWYNGSEYELIAKDITGEICGEVHAGIHAVSPDGVRWQLTDPPKAYSREVEWEDGSRTVQGSLERPQLLFHEGRPTHLFAATADGPGGFRNASNTWNTVLRIRENKE